MATEESNNDPFECPWCAETLRVVGVGIDRQIIEVASDDPHQCWETMVDYANLLVTDDPPPT